MSGRWHWWVSQAYLVKSLGGIVRVSQWDIIVVALGRIEWAWCILVIVEKLSKHGDGFRTWRMTHGQEIQAPAEIATYPGARNGWKLLNFLLLSLDLIGEITGVPRDGKQFVLNFQPGNPTPVCRAGG